MGETRMTDVRHEVSTQGEMSVLAIAGRLDGTRSGPLGEQWARMPFEGHLRIVLDLSGLEWIDSSGVGALISLAKQTRARGGAVKAACLQRQPKEVFRLLRLEAILETFDTVEEAVARLATR
jgi:anti-sigma B factor antagonist